MCFDVFGADKIEQFNIQMGEELTVSFDVDARQWNDRWFNSIRAWKVERVGAGAPRCPVPPRSVLPFTMGDAKTTSFVKLSRWNYLLRRDAKDDLPF